MSNHPRLPSGITTIEKASAWRLATPMVSAIQNTTANPMQIAVTNPKKPYEFEVGYAYKTHSIPANSLQTFLIVADYVTFVSTSPFVINAFATQYPIDMGSVLKLLDSTVAIVVNQNSTPRNVDNWWYTDIHQYNFKLASTRALNLLAALQQYYQLKDVPEYKDLYKTYKTYEQYAQYIETVVPQQNLTPNDADTANRTASTYTENYTLATNTHTFSRTTKPVAQKPALATQTNDQLVFLLWSYLHKTNLRGQVQYYQVNSGALISIINPAASMPYISLGNISRSAAQTGTTTIKFYNAAQVEIHQITLTFQNFNAAYA